VVALKRDIRAWPAGTTGTAVLDQLIEISDDRGQMLDLSEGNRTPPAHPGARPAAPTR
jgi:hypothetical protein